MADKDEDQFTDDERITANLRLRSVSPAGRTFLGWFFAIPPAWRGVVAIVLIMVLAYILIRVGPAAFHWIKQ